jgi:anti-sigma28 factor (negative regulator of flagellin synthesis)
MQISCQQLLQTQQQPQRRKRQTVVAPVTSVAELAARHGVDPAEVRRYSERVLLAAPDLQRERRIAELIQRIGDGSYQVDAEQVLAMTERRAQADRAAEL